MTYEYEEWTQHGETCYVIRMDGDVIGQSYLEENAQHLVQELNEAERLRAEVASLRVSLGQQRPAEDAEPIGCPTPGACSCVKNADELVNTGFAMEGLLREIMEIATRAEKVLG